MKLVNMNCPNCNGTLEFDGNGKTAVCKYCGSRWYLKEDEISWDSVPKDKQIQNPDRQVKKNADAYPVQSQKQAEVQHPEKIQEPRTDPLPAVPVRKADPEPEMWINPGGILSYFLVVLWAAFFVWFLSLDGSGTGGTLPVLGALIGGLFGSTVSFYLLLKFSTTLKYHGKYVPLGKLWGFLFIIFFLLSFL